MGWNIARDCRAMGALCAAVQCGVLSWVCGSTDQSHLLCTLLYSFSDILLLPPLDSIVCLVFVRSFVRVRRIGNRAD